MKKKIEDLTIKQLRKFIRNYKKKSVVKSIDITSEGSVLVVYTDSLRCYEWVEYLPYSWAVEVEDNE